MDTNPNESAEVKAWREVIRYCEITERMARCALYFILALAVGIVTAYVIYGVPQ